VAIGRAIVRKPGVFLFDEPLSNLDAGLRVQMRVELARLHTDLATTMVYVTHDQVEAMTLANRIVVINEGRIEQVGPPLELYHHPANRFVAGFIGSPKMNFLPCVLVSATEAGATVKLADGTLVLAGSDARGLAVGTALVMGIRPERIVAATEAGEGTAKTSVIVAEHLGDTIFLYVHTPGGTGQLTVKAKPENPLRTGDETHLSFPAKHCLLFGPDDRTLPRLF
jgi:multiple sugar transport system ATP-binding protein